MKNHEIVVNDERGCEDLLNAVVLQAVRDYLYGRCHDTDEGKRLAQESKRFLLSPYLRLYTKVQGRKLLEDIDKVLAACGNDYTKAKTAIKCYE